MPEKHDQPLASAEEAPRTVRKCDRETCASVAEYRYITPGEPFPCFCRWHAQELGMGTLSALRFEPLEAGVCAFHQCTSVARFVWRGAKTARPSMLIGTYLCEEHAGEWGLRSSPEYFKELPHPVPPASKPQAIDTGGVFHRDPFLVRVLRRLFPATALMMPDETVGKWKDSIHLSGEAHLSLLDRLRVLLTGKLEVKSIILCEKEIGATKAQTVVYPIARARMFGVEDAPESPDHWRPMFAGEVIQAGDEYISAALAWETCPEIAVGEKVPANDLWRRPVEGKVSDAIPPKRYRPLKSGEALLPGDEICDSGRWDACAWISVGDTATKDRAFRRPIREQPPGEPLAHLPAETNGLPELSREYTEAVRRSGQNLPDIELEQRDEPLAERVPDRVFTLVHEAIGAASMCWSPLPSYQVFESCRAANIAFNLLHQIGDEFEKEARANLWYSLAFVSLGALIGAACTYILMS